MKKSWVITAFALIIVGFIGLLFTKFDITDKKFIEFEHEYEFAENIVLEDFTLLGSSSNVNISFVPSENDKTIVTIEGRAELEVIEKIKQASLLDGHFELDIRQNESFRLLSIGFQESEINITASLPKGKMLSQLQLDMKSGNIKVNDLTAQTGKIEVSSGKVIVANSEVDSLAVNAKSGNIDVTEHKGKLDVSALSGNVNVQQQLGSSNIRVTSGKVRLVQHDNQGATINAKSGNVEVTQYKPSDADIEVFSGNVKLKVANDFAGFFDLKATSGNIKSPESLRQSNHLVKIRTTSGDISISSL